jgi:RNA polymerase sigma-70 factor (ECF subfamily)
MIADMDNHDDIALITRFKNGDKQAFEEIILRYQNKIVNLCMHMLANKYDAEDAAQEVFLKAYQALPRFRPDAALYTWLYRIAVNTCIDYKKIPILESLFGSSKEGEEVLLHDRASDGPSPEALYASKQIDRAFQAGLGKLSPKLRAIIILKEMEELSYEEIAETLEISMGTVKSRIARAREELKIFFKDFREQNSKNGV